MRQLQEAQARAEEEYLRAAPPPLRLPEPDDGPAGQTPPDGRGL